VERYRILIVGAGLAGLALARALRLAEFEPQIVERVTEWDGGGTGIYIPANGVRALRALSLEEAVVESAVEIPFQRFLNGRGRLLSEVSLRDLWGGVGPCIAMHRAELHRILLQNVDVPVQMATTVEWVEQAEGSLRVAMSDGDVRQYDLVVGADGIHSGVRRLAFDGRPPIPVGQLSWRFVTTSPAVTTWSVMLGRGAAFLTIPIGQSLVYCYCDVSDVAKKAPTSEIERLRRAFAGFAHPVPEILDRLEDPTDVYTSPLEEVAEEQWVRGTVVLVGDAAHGMSPNMAEGASLAFEDALVLAESLRAEPTIPDALAALVARRRPRTAWVRRQTHRRDRTRGLPPMLMDLVLRAAGRRIFVSNYRPLLEPF
jgi:FAD-dependent urate hydroxylase